MKKINLIHISQLHLSPKPRYLVEGIVPAQDITVVWGKPKHGKTYKVLDLALHVASGRSYRGHRVEQGPVVYCVLEGASAFPNRIEALRQAYELSAERTPFWISPDRFTFLRVGGAHGLIQGVRESLPTLPKLVVIDTLNRSLEGSENDDRDMTFYTKCIEEVSAELGCCAIIVVHHCGVAGDRPRGHTALTGTCAAQLKVSRVNKGPVAPGQPMMICLTVEFMKDGPEGEQIFSWLRPIPLGLDNNGQEITSCVVDAAAQPQTEPKPSTETSPQTAKAFAILIEATAKSPDGKITLTEWRNRCKAVKMGKSPEASRRAFYRAFDRLEADGIIRLEGEWVILDQDPRGGNGASKNSAPDSDMSR